MAESRTLYSRPNTLEEKRKMRNNRKKRRRSRVKALECHLQLEKTLRAESEKKVTLYKNMSRSYWERWRWELQQRKECIMRERSFLQRNKEKVTVIPKINEIDPLDETTGKAVAKYVGRGSFGVVRMQYYRGVKVAVKELLPRSLLTDMQKEARILARFNHPYLPLLYGVCKAEEALKIVMQYHGLGAEDKSLTLHEVLHIHNELCDERVMLTLCAQILEAMNYLHSEVKVIHNDLKCNNIVTCNCFTFQEATPENSFYVQIVIVDFGKATLIENGRHLYLTASEKSEYFRRYTHIAPEVIDGISRQSTRSDMYGVGKVIQKVLDADIFSAKNRKAMDDLATKCCSPKYLSRPTAKEALDSLMEIVM